MTENEWLACIDPTPMLEFLRDNVSDRKLRLFATACCRTVWPSISEVFREAIEVAEAHVDGRSTDAALGLAVSAAHRLRRKRNNFERAIYDAARSNGGAFGIAETIARGVASTAAPNASSTHMTREINGRIVTEDIPPNADRRIWDATFSSHLRLEASLLRDIVGPLLFRPLRTAIGVLMLSDSPVVNLASEIYDDRAFDRMPELTHALEQAGCTNIDILNHCRQLGPHVRGCWVIDLLTGRG